METRGSLSAKTIDVRYKCLAGTASEHGNRERRFFYLRALRKKTEGPVSLLKETAEFDF